MNTIYLSSISSPYLNFHLLKENKKVLDKVLLQVAQMEIDNIGDITIEELLVQIWLAVKPFVFV